MEVNDAFERRQKGLQLNVETSRYIKEKCGATSQSGLRSVGVRAARPVSPARTCRCEFAAALQWRGSLLSSGSVLSTGEPIEVLVVTSILQFALT